MNQYIISKGHWSINYKAESIELAQAYADQVNEGSIATLVEENIQPLTLKERYIFDKPFAEDLINLFLNENKELGPWTEEQSDEMTTKFSKILFQLQVGDVLDAKQTLIGLSIDGYLTEERKAKYLNLINEHISQH